MRSYKKSKDYKYSAHKARKSRSRSSSRSRSRSRERSDHSGKYKKKSHYYRNHRHERSRSYERASHRYDRDHPGHSRHRRWAVWEGLSFGIWAAELFAMWPLQHRLVNHLVSVKLVLLVILCLLSCIQRKDANKIQWHKGLYLVIVSMAVMLEHQWLTLQSLPGCSYGCSLVICIW